jgi:NTE family protein
VLDRLLEDGRFSFDCVSGSSAGAINAALLAAGLAKGGPEAAREQLERFWRRASGATPAPSLQHALAISSRVLSPYQFNPFDLNPLRMLLQSEINFELIRAKPALRLMLGATRVRDGGLQLFDETAVSVDVLLASACLPLLHRAVVIDGEEYWDGGYSANPPLIPLIEASTARDILVVQIVPAVGPAHPRSAADISRRLDHLTFNASLAHDLETIATVKRLAGSGAEAHGVEGNGLVTCTLHRVVAEDSMPHLDEADALNLDWRFLQQLRDAGRDAAAAWIEKGGRPADEAIAGYERPSPAAKRAASPSR